MGSGTALTAERPGRAIKADTERLSTLLDEHRAIEAARPMVSRVWFPTMRTLEDVPRESLPSWVASHIQDCEKALARCEDSVLTDTSSRLTAVLAEPPNRNVVRAAVGLYLDTRTQQPPNPRAYLEALVYDLVDLKFPPVVVVVALQEMRRTGGVFTPAISEVIARCEAVLDRYRAMHAEAKLAVVDRSRTERYLTHLRGRQDELVKEQDGPSKTQA